MFARILLIVGATLLAIVNGQFNSSSSTGSNGVMCGGAGYDLSSLAGLDIFIDVDPYRYSIHPCGVVSSALDACEGMICQNTTTIARYDTAQVDWAAIDNGVLMLVADGDTCGGNGPREAEISFICDSQATTPNFLSMTEVSICHYAGVIQTAAACTPVGATGPNGVGSDFFSTTCGAGAWDFTNLNSADITGTYNGYNWTVRVCGTVSNPDCAGSQPTSICQSNNNGNSWNLNYWAGAGGRALYELGNDGINMSMANGDDCGSSGNRSTIVQFSCNAAATTPVMVNAFEQYTCEYIIQIQTADVCGAPFGSNGTVSSSSGIFVNVSSSSGIFVNGSSSSSGIFVNVSSSSGVFVNGSSSSGIFVNGTSSSSSSGIFVNGTSSSSSSGIFVNTSSSSGSSSGGMVNMSSSTGSAFSSSSSNSQSSSVIVDSSSSTGSTGVIVDSSSSTPVVDSSSSSDIVIDSSSSSFVDQSSSSGLENPGPGDLNGASSLSIAVAVVVALMSVLASL